MQLFLMLFALVGVLSGCGDKDVQCSEDVACSFGEVCIDGTCSSKNCATSADCPMETTCAGGSCTAGCANDDDCYPGDACDTTQGQCAEASCRSTTLDCGFKEFCNTVTGECYEASGYYCLECFDDDDCGGNDNTCLSWGAYGNFCGVTCDTESDCPSGFTCIDVGSGGSAEFKQCVTYCWLYINDDQKAPPAGELPSPTPVDPTSPACESGAP